MSWGMPDDRFMPALAKEKRMAKRRGPIDWIAVFNVVAILALIGIAMYLSARWAQVP